MFRFSENFNSFEARFTKEGKLAWEHNPIKVSKFYDLSTDIAQIKEHGHSQILFIMTNTIYQEKCKLV